MAMELDSPAASPPHNAGGVLAPSPSSASAPTGTNTGVFDVDAYISRYEPSSETRLQRLLLIASHSATNETSRQAYVLAEKQMRDTSNVRRYREVFGGSNALGTSAGSGSGEAAAESARPEPDNASNNIQGATAVVEHNPSEYGFSYDLEFVSTTEKTSVMHLETLEARLSTAQAHLAKEAIRTAYLALAEFHRLRGDLRESLRRVLRSRDFCTNTRQSGQVCLMVIELGVDMRNYAQVRDYVAKAEHTSDLLHTDPLFASKLRVASALAYLNDGKYVEAARKLATVSPELTNQFNTVIASEDISLYGALLGLAALDRNELQDLILESSTFKGRLELVPVLREALRHYVLAEYGPCLSLLSSLMPDLQLDIHLRPHAQALYNMVRDRCVVQYFAPYSKVSLQTMSECFGISSVDEMETIVAKLIRAGKIRGGARINSLEKTLVAESPGTYCKRRKAEAREHVAKLGTNFLNETESLVLRLSCVENGLIVQDGRKGGGWGGGGGRTRGRGGRRGGHGGPGLHADYPDMAGGGEIMYGIDDDDSSVEDVGDHMDMDVDAIMAVNPEGV